MDLRSGYPFWQVGSGLGGEYPALTADVECEVAVIGGGVTGALIAHHLTSAGVSTPLLDKRDFGWGSTSATTALVQYELDVPLHELGGKLGEARAVASYRACLTALGKLGEIAADLGDSCGFERNPSLYLASWDGDVRELEREYEARCRHPFPVELWGAEEIASRFPFERPAGFGLTTGPKWQRSA